VRRDARNAVSATADDRRLTTCARGADDHAMCAGAWQAHALLSEELHERRAAQGKGSANRPMRCVLSALGQVCGRTALHSRGTCASCHTHSLPSCHTHSSPRPNRAVSTHVVRICAAESHSGVSTLLSHVRCDSWRRTEVMSARPRPSSASASTADRAKRQRTTWIAK
jgi:hypothetical protein